RSARKRNDSARREAPSERVLETDERRHLVTEAVIVEREEQVRIEEQAIDEIDLEAQRAAERIEGLRRAGDVAKDRRAVERVEILRAETLGPDQISTQHIESQRQVIVGADVGSSGVDRLIGE